MPEAQDARLAGADLPGEGGLPLVLDLAAEAATPLHVRIGDALRRAILERRIARGARLPGSRALADDLGCARGTVIAALEQLVAEGYLTAHRGSGTRVAATLPDDTLAVARASAAAPSSTASTSPPFPSMSFPPPPLLSRRGTALMASSARAWFSTPVAPDAFALGRPAADAFPYAIFGRLLQTEWRDGAAPPHPLGDPRLRAATAAYLAATRGVACTAEEVIVTAGIRQSLRLLGQLLLDPGETALVEDPGFPGIALALAEAGLRPAPVPVGPGGLAIDRAGAAMGARLAVVTPAHHYPLGHAMSLENRLALLAWAEAAGAWIVEDDYGGEYRYAGRPLPPLRALDRTGRVIYAGSFSKVLLPALQLSYLVLPKGLARPVQRALAETGPAPSGLGQGALARFIDEGHLGRHLRRTRKLHAGRQAALLDAARDGAAGLLNVAPLEGGMHLVARPGPDWPPGLGDVAAVAALARAGIAAVALSAYHADPMRAAPGLLLGYAAVPERAIAPAVTRMATILRATGDG